MAGKCFGKEHGANDEGRRKANFHLEVEKTFQNFFSSSSNQIEMTFSQNRKQFSFVQQEIRKRGKYNKKESHGFLLKLPKFGSTKDISSSSSWGPTISLHFPQSTRLGSN